MSDRLFNPESQTDSNSAFSFHKASTSGSDRAATRLIEKDINNKYYEYEPNSGLKPRHTQTVDLFKMISFNLSSEIRFLNFRKLRPYATNKLDLLYTQCGDKNL